MERQVMHPINLRLAPPVVEGIPRDDDENRKSVEEVLKKCLEKEVVEAKLIGRALRLIESRMALKYNNNIPLMSFIADSLLKIYTRKRISIPMRVKCLQTLSTILRYRKFSLKLSFTYDYRYFWDEMFSICTRSAKSKSCGSEMLNSKLFQALTEFLHEARHYTPPDIADSIADEAMDALCDLRSSFNMFGVHMLVLCLPTSYHNYDKWIDIWLDKLASITNNPAWDACWLTLLCRARKYCSNPSDWCKSALPQLLEKTRELLDPFSASSSMHPYSLPSYFAALKVSSLDYRKTALKKLSKLIYMTVHTGDVLDSLPPVTISPPSQAKDLKFPGLNQPGIKVHSGVEDLVLFLQSLRPYLFPSNVTARTPDLGYLISCLSTELGQHVGQTLLRTNLFSSLMQESECSKSDAFISCCKDSEIVTPINTATALYLAGVLCSISLEGLYAKSNFMVQCCTFSLRSLCSIAPSLGDYLMPFLLSSLHADAVNQSHMAPASMNAMAHIFKPLLFPRPVLLPYVDELLSLSLAGIDANDVKKTSTTLNMFIYLFGLFPQSYVDESATIDVGECRSNNSLPQFPGTEYLTVANTGLLENSNLQEFFRDFRSTLSPIVSRWIPLFIEKLFSLLKVKEQVKDSSGKIASSPLGPYIGEAFDVVVLIASPSIRLNIMEQVINFVQDVQNASAAPPAAKEISKMLESLTSYDPDCKLLRHLMDRLCTGSVDLTSASSEKISLQLRLVGGCVRQATGNNVVSVLNSIKVFFCDAYKHHSDKEVRRCVSKLLKDVLKGLTSFYPMCQDKVDTMAVEYIGSPLHIYDAEVNWHVPSERSVKEAVELMAAHVEPVMTEIEEILNASAADVSDDSEGGSMSVKQKEERLLTLFQLLQHGVRGAAEVLGDGSAYSCRDNHFISTGRQELLLSLPQHLQGFLFGFRDLVLDFINRVHSVLNLSEPTNSPEMISDPAMASQSQCNRPMVAIARNSPSVREYCTKLFRIVVVQRMACMKNIDSIKKWHKVTRRVKKSALCQYMEKKLTNLHYLISKGDFVDAKNAEWSITSLEYWVGHDVSQKSMLERSFIQHAIRQKEFSFNATHIAISEWSNSESREKLLLALHNLAELNGHEYDKIRSNAHAVFGEVSPRFGQGLEGIIRPQLEVMQTAGSSYHKVSGALNLFHLDIVMKRITGNSFLCLGFLHALRSMPSVLAAIDDADERSKLSDKLSSVFIKYLSMWHHLPFAAGDSSANDVLDLITSMLSDFGVSSGSTAIEGGSETVSVASGGLRHELHLASAVSHFIGHEDIQHSLPPTVWSWLSSLVRTRAGTPTQTIAICALTKLAFVHRDLSQSIPSVSKLIASILLDAANEESSAVELLKALSHGHCGNAKDAQWSKGVDQMLRNGQYLRNVVPRLDSGSADLQMFSKMFHIGNANLVMNLVDIALGCDDVSLNQLIESLLRASEIIPATSDEEVRAANTTRAEVFSGVSRLLRQAEKDNSQPAEICKKSWEALKSFLFANISRISLDYCGDWSEGIVYGFNRFPTESEGGGEAFSADTIFNSVLEVVLHSLSRPSETDASTTSDSSSVGFTRSSKHLNLLTSFLVADITAVSRCRGVSEGEVPSLLAVIVRKRLLEVGYNSTFSSPYLTLRVELSKLLCLLILSDSKDDEAFTTLASRVSSECQGPCQASIGPVVESSATTSLAETNTSALEVAEVASTSSVSAFCNDSWKNGCDLCKLWLAGLTQSMLPQRYCALIRPLLLIILEGCCHSEVSFSKQCHNACKAFTQGVKVGRRSCSNAEDILSVVLAVFLDRGDHSSLHVRETVAICLTYLLVNNSSSMTMDEKKRCKDVFARGLLDEKPEVRVLSRKGMVAYLATKKISDLAQLAGSYEKNCDILANREKKRRRTQKCVSQEGVADVINKPDDVYLSTISMSACMVLLFPYDIPSYVPSLLTALVRHSAHPTMRDLVTKTVQDFKATHQDRWEEFKSYFSHEQLEDVQGAGAAHYFS